MFVTFRDYFSMGVFGILILCFLNAFGAGLWIPLLFLVVLTVMALKMAG